MRKLKHIINIFSDSLSNAEVTDHYIDILAKRNSAHRWVGMFWLHEDTFEIITKQ